MADLVLSAIQFTRVLLTNPNAANRTEVVATSAPTLTTVSQMNASSKELPSPPNMRLYFGIGCGVLVVLALMGISYLFLRGLISRKQEETIPLSDLRQFACQSRPRSCSPDFSPSLRSTMNSEASKSPAATVSPDWHTISDGSLSPMSL